MILRPYQAECIERVLIDFALGKRSVLAVLATGLGKTVIGSGLIDIWGKRFPGQRVLWLAHREELIEQAAEAIEALTGESVAVEMAQRRSDEHSFMPARVVVSSVQTMSRHSRQRRFDPRQFGLIVTDEAHHAIARSYRGIYHYFRHGNEDILRFGNPDICHLGITATPNRSDNLAMGKVFDSEAFKFGINDGIREGWLVPFEQQTAIIDSLDYLNIREVAGDLDPGQLEAELTKDGIIQKMVLPTFREAGSRPALYFCVGVKQARDTAAVINGYRPGSAAFVSGETPKDERKRIIHDYKSGQIQFLCNCGVFLEGFDAPATALVVMGRPTKSLSLYVQMLGRGTRPLKGTVEHYETAAERRAAIAASAKPFMTVLDFVGNANLHGEHCTVNAVDVLGGDYGEPVTSYAKKVIEKEKDPAKVQELLDRSQAELDLLREEEERRVLKARVEYRLRTVGTDAGPVRETAPGSNRHMATDKQIWRLCKLGVSRAKAESFTKRQASVVIDKLQGNSARP